MPDPDDMTYALEAMAGKGPYSVAAKADYVRSKTALNVRHHCHWPGCPLLVPPAKWGCRRHWFMLPLRLRNKIWAAFRPGQEVAKNPSRRYVEVAREVQEWINAHR